jgi:hypothetical protein
MSERAIQDNNMKKFFSACEIVMEGYDSIDILNEGVGDNLKNGWNKFIQFIKETFAKFNESLSNLFNSEKGWLDQYKDIILKKRPDENISFDDFPAYDIGIQRISRATVPLFNPDSDAEILKDSESFLKHICPNIGESMNTLFPEGVDKNTSSGLTTYFKGGEPRQGVKITDLNMTDLWNFCYNYKTLASYIEKDNKAITSSVNNANKAITDAISNLDEKDKATTTEQPKGSGTDNKTEEENKDENQVDEKTSAEEKSKLETQINNVPDPVDDNTYNSANTQTEEISTTFNNSKTKMTDADKKSIITKFKNLIDKINKNKYMTEKKKTLSVKNVSESVLYAYDVINEDIKKTPNSTSSSSAQSTGVYSDKTTSANKQNIGNTIEDRKANANNAANNNGGDKAKAVDEITNKLNIYQKCAQDVMVAKSSAIQTIFKDYMTVMREHVRSIVGKEDQTANVAQQASTNTADTSRYSQARFDDIKRVKNAYDAADPSNKDDKSTKLTQYADTVKKIYGTDAWNKRFAELGKDSERTANYFANSFLNGYNKANNSTVSWDNK